MNILFCRISKDEIDSEEMKKYSSKEAYLKNKWEQQKRAVISHFKIESFDKEFYDSGSAYKIEDFKKRDAFHKMLDFIFDYSNVTLKDLFWGSYDLPKEINIYVYDYNRLSRMIEYGMLFSVLADLFDIKIYSCNQDNFSKKENEEVKEKGVRYVFLAITAMSSEDYSAAISKNTKKAVVKRDYLTLSSNDNVWGKGFKRCNGEKMSPEETHEMIQEISKQIKYYERRGAKQYYEHITSHIIKKFRVEISKSTLTKLKQRME